MAVGCAAAALAVAGAPAHASERIYWANSGSEEGISWANVDGSGGGTLETGDATIDDPGGVTIDPAAGKLYWANEGSDTISWAYLDGSGGGDLDTTGATVSMPLSLSIDEAAGRIYWGNIATISYASLDGGGGGNLSISGASAGNVDGIAVDPSLGLVFWGSMPGAEPNHLSRAKLDGSGGADLGTGSFHPAEPFGVAMDNAESILYFVNKGTEGIYGSLGPGGPVELIAGAASNATAGLAVDPVTEQIYWINPGSGTILHAPTFENNEGSPGGFTPSESVLSGPNFPALLAPPTPVSPPSIGGSGSGVTCGEGEWGGDFSESQYFRAPTSFSYDWTRDGQLLATHTSTISAPESGSYKCRVTASNAAGSAEQASGSITVLSPPKEEKQVSQGTLAIGKPKLNKKTGTATLPVAVPGAGALALSGKNIAGKKVAVKSGASSTVKLVIKAKGKAKQSLGKTGVAKVTAKVAFTPTEGPKQTASKKLKLVKKLG